MAHRGEKKPEKVTFADVVGCDEAKDEIKQVKSKMLRLTR